MDKPRFTVQFSGTAIEQPDGECALDIDGPHLTGNDEFKQLLRASWSGNSHMFAAQLFAWLSEQHKAKALTQAVEQAPAESVQ